MVRRKNNVFKTFVVIVIIIFIVSFVFYIYDKLSITSTVATNEPHIIDNELPVNTAELKVHFIDVGQADATFIDYGNYDILIDAGNNSDGELIVNYLKKLNTDNIEILVATHPHEDHIGGLDDVLAAFDIETIVDSGKTATTKTYRDYWDAVQAENAAYQEDQNMDFVIDDGIVFRVIEAGDEFEDTNDYSVVTLLDYNDIEFIFTGDAERNVEKVLLNKNIEADVLKVGHHGSGSSTTQVFLDMVNPQYAVIMCGKDNKYGHPHEETIEKLNKANIEVYRTDFQGNIIAITDGKAVRFETK